MEFESTISTILQAAIGSSAGGSGAPPALARPDLWGVALGALIALLGVGIKLLHSSREKRKEREHTLKRDVYLQAAEGVARGQEFLASFGRLDLDDATLASLNRGSIGWANKVHAVARFDTIQAFVKAQEYLVSNAFGLTVKRAKLRHELQQIGLLGSHVSQLGEHLQQISVAFDQVQPEQLTPEAVRALPDLVQYLKENYQRLSSLQEEVRQRQDEKDRKNLELVEESLRISAEYSKHIAEVNVQVRNELDLPIDEARYRELVDEASKTVLKDFAKTIGKTAAEVLSERRAN